MQTVIDGVLVNYEVLGNSKKDAILMLHGWGRNLNDWNTSALELAKDFRIILVDLPGFGNSSLPQISLDTYDYASFVQSFIKKLKLKNLILIGHSFGGKAATIAAARSDTIKKLLLLDSSGVESKSLNSKIKIIVSKIIKPLTIFLPKKIKQAIFEVLASEDYKNAGPLKESFKKIISQDVSEEAKQIKIPTLIVWGDQDTEVPLSAAKRFKSLIKNSRIKIVWGAKHHPQLEKPQKFIEIVKDFISS